MSTEKQRDELVNALFQNGGTILHVAAAEMIQELRNASDIKRRIETMSEDILSLAETEARAECARRGIDPDELCADGGITAWMVVDQERRHFAAPTPPAAEAPAPINSSTYRDFEIVLGFPTDLVTVETGIEQDKPAVFLRLSQSLYADRLPPRIVFTFPSVEQALAVVDAFNRLAPPAAEAPGAEPDGWIARDYAGKEWLIYKADEAAHNERHGVAVFSYWLSAPPTHADAEAKGLEKAANLADDSAREMEHLAASQVFDSPARHFCIGRAKEARHLATTIRSLASPAPK